MAAPLSQDLRRRVVQAVEAGVSAREAAARFAVSASAAIKLVRRVRATGSTAPGRIGGHRKPLLAGQEGFLRELTTGRKGITLAEIRDALVQRGVGEVSLTTIWSTLRRLGLRHKKSRSGPRSRTARMSRSAAASGGSGSAASTRRASSSSTRPGLPPT
jgi:transposase